MTDFIKTSHLSFSYPDEESGIPAISDVNITIQKGEYVAMLGHNGSGKSTLAKLLNLILLPSEGSIEIDGISVDDGDIDEETVYEIRKKVGMVFQNPDNQLVSTIVEEDVAFGPENLGLPRPEIRRRVDEALSLVGMSEYAQRAPHHLSGGQKQRIAIAGVIAMRPECIIFDESTAMLDPSGRREVLDTMERLNREEGITVIHITHYMEEAARADRIIVIDDGKLLTDGTPSEVFSKAEELAAAGLELPQGTALLYALEKEGYAVPRGVVDPSLCCREILKLLGGSADE